MLLAAATPARSGDRVADFGAGVGAAGLAVARRVAGIDLVLVEIDPDLAGLARDNADANAIAAESIVLDVEAAAASVCRRRLCSRQRRRRADESAVQRFRAASRLAGPARGIAHVATASTLANWIHAARRILKSRGMLTLIWRADGIAEVLAALDHGFGSLAILPIHGDVKEPAIRVLVRAIKGGRAPTQIHAGLMLNDELGVPNKEVQDILAGKGILPLANP